MKKVLLFSMIILIFVLTLCSCSLKSSIKPADKDYDIMVMINSNQGLENIEEDFWTSTQYILNTNGKLTRIDKYNLSEDQTETINLTEEQKQI